MLSIWAQFGPKTTVEFHGLHLSDLIAMLTILLFSQCFSLTEHITKNMLSVFFCVLK